MWGGCLDHIVRKCEACLYTLCISADLSTYLAVRSAQLTDKLQSGWVTARGERRIPRRGFDVIEKDWAKREIFTSVRCCLFWFNSIFYFLLDQLSYCGCLPYINFGVYSSFLIFIFLPAVVLFMCVLAAALSILLFFSTVCYLQYFLMLLVCILLQMAIFFFDS